MSPNIEKQLVQGFLKTPPLWQNTQFGLKQFYFPDIDILKFEPLSVPENIRLGHKMEHVCKQLLASSNRYEIVFHNLPIRVEKRTIGEIDFILKDLASQQLLHVELTYKFYLILPEISEPIHRLIGPNKRDMFFTKMEKIKNEQFPLAHTPQVKSLIVQKEPNISDIISQVCFKAQLFKPYHEKLLPIGPLDKQCIIGFWLKMEQFNTDEFKAFEYYIPSKTEWVISPHENVRWSSHNKTMVNININLIKKRAPMIWMRTSDADFEKLFVVWW